MTARGRFAGLACLAALWQAGPTAADAPLLFDSSESLAVTVEAPVRDLVRKRRDAPEYAGTVRYTEPTGEERALPVAVSVRGHSRLQMCDFPPVRLTFDRDVTAGTLFADIRSLKLVTRCLRSSKARDWAKLEFGAYRVYNAITPYSYRVRRLELTWRDTEARAAERRQIAFVIEPDRLVEARLGREKVRPPEVLPEQLSLEETTHYMLFQYFIGNTDFAVKRGPSGEGCCHNGRVFAADGATRDFIVLPYDFDQSGIVDPDYALPDRRLGIRKVSQRLYRGFCWQNDRLPESIRLFNEKRAEIEAAFPESDLSRLQARRVQRFIGNFYDTVNDPKELQERLLDQCRGSDSLPLRESPVSPSHERTP